LIINSVVIAHVVLSAAAKKLMLIVFVMVFVVMNCEPSKLNEKTPKNIGNARRFSSDKLDVISLNYGRLLLQLLQV